MSFLVTQRPAKHLNVLSGHFIEEKKKSNIIKN